MWSSFVQAGSAAVHLHETRRASSLWSFTITQALIAGFVFGEVLCTFAVCRLCQASHFVLHFWHEGFKKLGSVGPQASQEAKSGVQMLGTVSLTSGVWKYCDRYSAGTCFFCVRQQCQQSVRPVVWRAVGSDLQVSEPSYLTSGLRKCSDGHSAGACFQIELMSVRSLRSSSKRTRHDCGMGSGRFGPGAHRCRGGLCLSVRSLRSSSKRTRHDCGLGSGRFGPGAHRCRGGLCMSVRSLRSSSKPCVGVARAYFNPYLGSSELSGEAASLGPPQPCA